MINELKRIYKEICCFSRISIRPLKINLAITDECNLRCPTCSKWRGKRGKEEISKDAWMKIIRSLRGFALTNLLVFGGAESFCKRDFLEILGFSREMSFKPVIISNGTLIGRQEVEELSRSGIRQIIVSLNGVKSKTHDRTRGVDGCFEKTVKAVDLLGKKGVPVVLETVILRSNLGELGALVRLVGEKNLKGIQFQVLTAGNVHNRFQEDRNRLPDPGWFRSDPEWVDDREAIDSVMKEIIGMKKQGFPIMNSMRQLRLFSRYYRNEESVKRIPCPSGYTNFLVDPYGNVRLCYSLEPAGNLLEQGPREIWKSEKARRLRHKIRQCPASCRILNNNW